MESVGNFYSRQVVVAQHELGSGDDGTVDPLLRRHATGLFHHRSQVTLRQTHTVGIEFHLMFALTMVVDEIDKPVEDVAVVGFLTALGRQVGSEKSIKEIQNRRHEVER